MDAQRLTAEGASRPLSVPAGSYLDDEGTCFLPAVASSGLRLHSPSRAPGGGAASTSQGHPRTVFKRALERDNLVLAEVTAREIGHVEEHPTATIARRSRRQEWWRRACGLSTMRRTTRLRRPFGGWSKKTSASTAKSLCGKPRESLQSIGIGPRG